MISLGAHGILACVELACYLILSVPIAFNAVRYASHNQTGWLYVGLFVLGENSSMLAVLSNLHG